MSSIRSRHLYETAEPTVWGLGATSLVRALCVRRDVRGLRVLDAGCGEGRNAAYLAARGAAVHAVDADERALARAASLLGDVPGIEWVQADLTDPAVVATARYDVVVLYSLTHWLSDRGQVADVVGRLRAATHLGGEHLYCAFNDRVEYPHAAAELPLLLSHEEHRALYRDWDVVEASDTDLRDQHADGPPHVHSVTRLVARRPG